MKFVLEIDLGRDRMCTVGHVAYALIKVAEQISNTIGGLTAITTPEAPRNLQDTDGNTVGFWAITEETP